MFSLKNKIVVMVAVILTFCAPFVASAQTDKYGLGKTAGAAGLKGIGGDVPTLAGNVVGTALSMVGVLFFILMVYGGFLWMTARGNEDQTKKAFSTITAAVIGIIIVMAAYAVTNFVFSSVKGGAAGGTNGCRASSSAIAECTSHINCEGIKDQSVCQSPLSSFEGQPPSTINYCCEWRN